MLLALTLSYSDEPWWVSLALGLATSCGEIVVICATVIALAIIFRASLGRLVDRVKSASYPGGMIHADLTDVHATPFARSAIATGFDSRLVAASREDVEVLLSRFRP